MNRLVQSSVLASLCLVAAAAAGGCDKPAGGAAATAAATGASAAPKDARRIDITASNDGYAPSTVDVKKGETVVLRFKRTTKSECLSQVKIPKLGIVRDLPVDQPVEIPVKAEQDGDIPFECGMSMVHGKIHVGS
ncbi:MAG TPA: cupredoxin domain-containing protein [Minicystis sp.]|nr:cupredoxin domain-containing protein [Minicystis sp.]